MKLSRIVTPLVVIVLAGFAAGQAIGPYCGPVAVLPDFPSGGQPNIGITSLNQSPYNQGAGPIQSWGPGGGASISTHNGAAGLPAILIYGTAVTGWLNTGPTGILDIDFTTAAAIYDNFGVFGVPDGTNCPVSLPYGLPTGITAMLVSVQGLNVDPGSSSGVRFTARNDVGVQNLATLGVPELPPFQVNTTNIPITAPANTIRHPFPRDVICPNNGVASSAPGANDGTRFRACGQFFDATVPGATTAAVNGIAVDIVHVTPTEIFFYLNSNHVLGVAGAMVITSTGGVYTPPGDQMEAWVHLRPATGNIQVEPPNTGYGGAGAPTPGVSATFATTLGLLQAATGIKNALGQVDFIDWSGLPPGVQMRVYEGEYHTGPNYPNPSNQIITQCSGLPSTPAALCYVGPFPGNTGVNNFTMQPFGNGNPYGDMFLGQTLMIAPGVPAPPNGSFGWNDDGGPGTNSFFGNSHIPTAATIPSLDPDIQMVALGAVDALECNDFTNPTPGGYPYNWLVIAIRTN